LTPEEKNFKEGGCEIVSYINDMPTYLKAADIAICRSGAMTISELCASGVYPILIPSPNVTNNHQHANARLLCEKEAATMIDEKNLTAEVLIKELIRLKNDENGRKKQAKRIKALSTPNAARAIINELETIKNNQF
jgi:UDP-N-acetylglucosamine--N-acetylmuramyl-(pentapeptide) pyrophosphoryl-undecaprenol N-acetylglucosamine transferase